MPEVLALGDISIDVVFKDIKNVHLSVYPPEGRVRIAAPERMSLDAIRVFAIAKIGWIKKQQQKFLAQDRDPPREYLERESHYLWGRRYLLHIQEGGRHFAVHLKHRVIELEVPEGTSQEKRKSVLDEWYREELRSSAIPIIQKWEKHLNVQVVRFFIQRMKTKWGSSSPDKSTIRLNLELAKFETQCLDYVVLHEMAHFLAPNHSERFVAIMNKYLPNWRIIRDKLNEGPLAHFE